ncbi:hypothetical protein G1H10_06810 [Phytoactinopolyspora halotolerans]|uniref:FAD-binding domain-containing protein n=1 Tax=Phytoactinopolyspora halotolerans TaxID=1981512 RepID=A0A6L9S425_9ACTN|nr:hypothetical protein [Phytoactinopolyspora halotolerans]
MLAESDRRYDITVVERGRPAERPGFGITLREEGLSFLDLGTMISGVHLQGRAFWKGGAAVVDLPNPASTHLICFSRAAFVNALTKRCIDADVEIRYGCDGATLSDTYLEDFDLVVGADGADSAVRRRYETDFKPEIGYGANRYGWFGVDTAFEKLTIMLPEDGTMLGWAYKYSAGRSTFIVECTETRFRSNHFDELSAEDTARRLGEIFATELGEGSVACGDAARWMRFGTITNTRLRHRNVVLIGDAAHTTHFSQGVGTMFAFDDVLALQSALDQHHAIVDALDAYEALQQPKIAEYQEIATASMRWSEKLLDCAERGDDACVSNLIAQRWPDNAVPPGPMNSGDRM